MLAIRLPKDTEQRLTALAVETNRTKSFYVREALNAYLEDLEDYYLAEKISADVRSGKEKVYTLAEAKKELGF